MTDTPQVLLAHHLKTLKLPTFLREYDKIARQCASEGVDHVRYLLRLAELELIDRARRRVGLLRARRVAPGALPWTRGQARSRQVVPSYTATVVPFCSAIDTQEPC